jgi:hypothetical protein
MPAVALINSNDPMFEFEHMMAHRQYFAIMGTPQTGVTLAGFSVLPYSLEPANTVPGDWNLRHQTSHDDFNSNLPSNANNGYTSTTITPPNLTAIGNSIPAGTASTTLQLTSVTPPQIIIGSLIFGFGVTITAQQTGTPGGDGNYTISGPLNVTGAAMTISHAPYQEVTIIENPGTMSMNQPGILLEGMGNTPEQQSWWTFVNHQQHYEMNNAILPLPTTAAMTAVTGPDQTVVVVSNPWWWAQKGPVIYPFW